MTTNVPAPTFGPNGFVAPEESAVLAGVQADLQAAFGGQLNFTTTGGSATNPTPQGQLAASEAAIIGEVNDTFVALANGVDPAYADGRMQDAIGRIYFIERLPSEPTVLQVACGGAAGVDIPVGTLVQDPSGNTYASTAAGTIPTSGSITLPFANQVSGPIAIPLNLTIYQAIPGWDTVSVVSGALGQDTETRSQFEDRRRETVAGNSFGAIGSIVGAVAQVPGVLDYWGYDNATNAPATVLGVTIPANSIFVAVVGGTQQAVAQAIFSKKAPGCSYSGNTSVTVQDTNPLYSTPPSYTVTYETPAGLEFVVSVNLVAGATVPSNYAALVQNAIIGAFAGSDGGPRARIASLVLATRYIAPIAALGSWAQVRSIQIGTLNTASAQFTGSINGTLLTISSVASGTVMIGQTLDDGLGGVIPGTTITAGSGSSWTVSASQNVNSKTMYGVVANQNAVQVNGNQEPEITAANIAVTAT